MRRTAFATVLVVFFICTKSFAQVITDTFPAITNVTFPTIGGITYFACQTYECVDNPMTAAPSGMNFPGSTDPDWNFATAFGDIGICQPDGWYPHAWALGSFAPGNHSLTLRSGLSV